eukprot:CAMPEP_0174756616 /NCGR_PEP_ID=MMETSP1094-20130205/106844_1 /TAXON_ID=156173 /ORGANISM="Chrysochromulina brevifilum, Strain UTEX LB 985" /LENGTH=204 /DNA_ID=CAMNT_0015962525 /DNA_START=724 /DNA_END=1338 /DNA_ORIENTATION=-
MTLLGALLAGVTAHELRKTACPLVFRTTPSALALPWWSDESATIVSCGCYVVGNIVFIVGSVLFFPRILESGGPVVRVLAVVLFVVGSIAFLAGAVIDLLVVRRSDLLTQDRMAERSADRRNTANAFIWRSLTSAQTLGDAASAIRNSFNRSMRTDDGMNGAPVDESAAAAAGGAALGRVSKASLMSADAAAERHIEMTISQRA